MLVYGHRATRKEAEQLRTRLLSKVGQGRTSGSKATLGEVLERWLDAAELEMTTRTATSTLRAGQDR
ncbi:MAG: hypothetical protein ACRDZO_05745 [Egibacteraceae bacterium]